MKNIIVDTSALLSGKLDFKELEKIYIPISTLEEIETISEFGSTEDRRERAQKALADIKYNFENVQVVIEIEPVGRHTWLNLNTPIGVTLMYVEYIINNLDFETVFVTNDLSTSEKAKCMKVQVCLL